MATWGDDDQHDQDHRDGHCHGRACSRCDIRDAAFYALRGDREALIILIHYTSIDL